ncbi:hypothetical protein ZEAMMB73_Zm00001d010921 [Zea mays]|uniref:Uncharacterized protein n=1 Tax=Zea mays TaxID=4577 RepID=A0A1D6FUY3_MAIZE|nr:hypothetical protein ZEAMMB73_Zm00001d010921 [Zea mays]
MVCSLSSGLLMSVHLHLISQCCYISFLLWIQISGVSNWELLDIIQ